MTTTPHPSLLEGLPLTTDELETIFETFTAARPGWARNIACKADRLTFEEIGGNTPPDHHGIWHTVTARHLEHAVDTLADDIPPGCELADLLDDALEDPDRFETIDGTLADALIQAAVFGRVPYAP
ncbi:MAG: hypothetical protein ACF8PN_08005 [Phycisphaerales bacterium]